MPLLKDKLPRLKGRMQNREQVAVSISKWYLFVIKSITMRSENKQNKISKAATCFI